MKRSNVIALAGISAALSYVAIILSFYVDIMTLSFGAIAGISLMLPLAVGSVSGAIFAYVSASILSGLTVGFGALTFIIFFGPFTIIGYLVDFKLYEKLKLKKWAKLIIGYTIKGVYYSISVTAVYFIMSAFGNVDFLLEPQWLWLGVIALILIFFLFDILLHMVFVNLRYLVRTRILKIHDGDTVKKDKKTEEIIDNVFDDDNQEDDSHDDNSDIINSSSTSRFEHFLELEKKDENKDDNEDKDN